MIIICPHCQTRYTVTAEKIGSAGRTIKCANCGESWFQAPSLEAESPTTPPSGKTPPLPPLPDIPAPSTLHLPHIPLPLIIGGGMGIILLMSGLIYWLLAPNASGPTGYSAVTFQGDMEESVLHQPTGLILSEIERDLIEEGPIQVLVFRGKVTNTNPVPVTVPEIRVQLLNERGIELDFWPAELEQANLAPEETTTWLVRFLNPPLDDISQFKAFFRDNNR